MKVFVSLVALLCASIGAAWVHAADVTLAWDPNAEPVDGYRLYYGTTSGVYTDSMDAGDTTQATLTGLNLDTTYYIVVRAYNIDGESGNSNEVSWQQSSPDTTAPTVSAAGPAQTTEATISLTGTASDNVAVASVTWSNDRGGSGTAQGTTAWTATGVPLQEGVNTITVTATDAAGNSGTDSIQVTLNLPDTTAPTVSVSGPTQTQEQMVNLSGTAADNKAVATVTWSNDRGGSGTAQGTSSWTAANIALQEGVNTITVTATDAAGNSGTGSIQITRVIPDVDAPSVQVSGPSITSNPTITLTGTASDNIAVASVTWSNDRGGSGTAQGTGTWTAANIALQEGVNIITVTATDAAGNTGTAGIQVICDRTPPAPPVGIRVSGM